MLSIFVENIKRINRNIYLKLKILFSMYASLLKRRFKNTQSVEKCKYSQKKI